MPMQVTTHLLDPGWGSDPHGGPLLIFLVLMVDAPEFSGSTSQGVCNQHFLTLMVDVPGSLSAPAKGPTVNVS
jgi:hypothetical protein